MMVDVTTDHTLPIIGRADELRQLRSLLGLDGVPQAGSVLLDGDAGVGKTRLLMALRDEALAAGWRVVAGHCLDFGDSALPYLPFTEIFGRLATEVPAVIDSLAEEQPGVRRLLPGRRLLSDTDAAPSGPMERGDLFESVHAAFERLAGTEPLLLVVEDVHWADQSTREMLSFCFTRQFTRPVAIVASYRTDDLHRRHPLRATAAEWSRLPQVATLHLRPLSDPHVRTLVHSLHPAPMRESDVHAIVARAEGNAFFAEELVVASELGNRTLPWHLADLLLVRLDQFDEATRLVVRAAACAGRRVSHDLLADVVGLDATALDVALRSAVEGNVLVAVGPDGYAFRHALLAEAIYDDLLPGERVRLHTAYSTALRSGDVEGTAAELARHARAAHDVPTAIQSSIRAGDEAMSVGGPDEAAQHYEMALDLLAQGRPDDAEEPTDIVQLTVKAAEAVTASGHPHRAVALVQDQLMHLPASAPPEDRARLLLALATAALLGDTDVDPLKTTSEALGLVPAEHTPLRAQVLTLHARANADRQRDDDALAWAGEALTLGRELDLPQLVADVNTTLARLEQRAGDPEGSERALKTIVAQAREDGDVGAELRGLHHLGSLHHEAGQLPEALAVYQLAAHRATETGRPWAPHGFDARLIAGVTAYMIGDWQTALEVVDVSGQTPPPIAEAALATVVLAVKAGRGEVEGAGALLDQIRPWWDLDGMIAIHCGSAAIDLHGDKGDAAAAVAVHDDVVDAVIRLWQRETFQARVRLSALLLGQLAQHTTRATSADFEDLARRGAELAAAAVEAAERGTRRGRPMGPEGVAWVARVDAEHARLRWLTGVDAPDEQELVDGWLRASQAFERLGHVFETARSQARLAAVLRAIGRPADARAPADAARETAQRLGAAPLLAEVRALGAVGSTRGTTARGEAGRRDEALTPREQEILALVAQGRSNSEIGRRLFISAKTVSVHVSNILAKLRASSRTEAAAVARSKGLLTDEVR